MIHLMMIFFEILPGSTKIYFSSVLSGLYNCSFALPADQQCSCYQKTWPAGRRTAGSCYGRTAAKEPTEEGDSTSLLLWLMIYFIQEDNFEVELSIFKFSKVDLAARADSRWAPVKEGSVSSLRDCVLIAVVIRINEDPVSTFRNFLVQHETDSTLFSHFSCLPGSFFTCAKCETVLLSFYVAIRRRCFVSKKLFEAVSAIE